MLCSWTSRVLSLGQRIFYLCIVFIYLFFAAGDSYCRDSWLVKVVSISDCSAFSLKQDICITQFQPSFIPSRLQEHQREGARKIVGAKGWRREHDMLSSGHEIGNVNMNTWHLWLSAHTEKKRQKVGGGIVENRSGVSKSGKSVKERNGWIWSWYIVWNC